MNIIVALLIFTVIVVIHELGHFLLAKKNGIGVPEFSVGMGPRLITYAKTKEGHVIKLLCSQKEFESRMKTMIPKTHLTAKVYGQGFQ